MVTAILTDGWENSTSPRNIPKQTEKDPIPLLLHHGPLSLFLPLCRTWCPLFRAEPLKAFLRLPASHRQIDLRCWLKKTLKRGLICRTNGKQWVRYSGNSLEVGLWKMFAQELNNVHWRRREERAEKEPGEVAIHSSRCRLYVAPSYLHSTNKHQQAYLNSTA